MNRRELKWVIYEASHMVAALTVWNFISLFIWEKEKSVTALLHYHIPLFLFIPIFGYLGARITKTINAKLSFYISFIARGGLLIFASYFSEILLNNIAFFGIIYAITVGLQGIPRNTIFNRIVDKDRLSRINAILLSISTFIGLILPIFGAFIINSFGSYSYLFVFALFCLLFSAAILSTVEMPKIDKGWDFLYVIKERSPDHNNLIKINFFNGVKGGIEWALFGALILFFLDNNIAKWGIYSSMISLVGVLAGLFYAKFIASKVDIAVLLVTGVIYTAFSIIFVSNFTFMWFLMFLVVNSIAGKFMGSSMGMIVSEMIREDKKAKEYLEEHFAFMEFPLAVGRLIPLSILLVSHASFQHDPVLKLIFVVVGLVPLIVTGILKNANFIRYKFIYSWLK